MLFARLEPHDPSTDTFADYSGTKDTSAGKTVAKVMKAVGHYSISDHWAFLNLVSLILTVLTLLPVFAMRRKYRQLGYAKRRAKELKDQKETDKHIKEIYDDLRSFVRKMRTGIVIELLIAAAAVLIFIFTEDLSKRLVISDKYTWLMVLTEAAEFKRDAAITDKLIAFSTCASDYDNARALFAGVLTAQESIEDCICPEK
ncbi:MAG: hypothetical protein IKN66_04845 [Ruminococcus sp.]|nr:hypothetical protein [Ruminococcus sp.]